MVIFNLKKNVLKNVNRGISVIKINVLNVIKAAKIVQGLMIISAQIVMLAYSYLKTNATIFALITSICYGTKRKTNMNAVHVISSFNLYKIISVFNSALLVTI